GVGLGWVVADWIRGMGGCLYDLAGLAGRATVRPEGADRILVRLAPSSDAKRLIDVATRRGKLEFRIVDVSMTPQDALRLGPPAGSEVLYGRDDKVPYLVEKYAAITSPDLADAQAGFDPRTRVPVLNFHFNTAAAPQF